MTNQKILAIIPARGGSKGIPRKNLRLLNGFPLIYYAITTCLKSKLITDVYLTSEDKEILTLARKFGAKTYERPAALSDDHITLDPVIYDAYSSIKEMEKTEYDIVVTIQPTSPLLKYKTLDNALNFIMSNDGVDTLISATDDTHLTWKKIDNGFIPNYEKRVNRQLLPKIFRETGSFLITKASFVTANNRIGKNVQLHIIPDIERIDIDSYEDWNICEYYLKRKNILFVVTGYHEVGLGHVYNTLSLADSILNHNITFLVDKDSRLGYEKIAESNHSVFMQNSDDIVEDIMSFEPGIVINDILDTNEEYIRKLKELKLLVINIEDLGEGSKHADLVINAMYPEKSVYPDHYYGQDYFCLRNEFQFSMSRQGVNEKVKNVLLSFGGVDPSNYTHKVVNAIYEYCLHENIQIDIALGLGYKMVETLNKFESVNIYNNIPYLSELVFNADIVFTSAGRTTFEIASIGIPTIVLAQNQRELTHFFANENNGFINLGFGQDLTKEQILNSFIDLLTDYEKRLKMHRLMIAQNVKKGKDRVIYLINEKINSYYHEAF